MNLNIIEIQDHLLVFNSGTLRFEIRIGLMVVSARSNQSSLQNQFVFWANAPGFILSIWLNMAAAKLQYSDRMATSMRASFVQLLDSNRQSLRQHASAKSNAQIHTNFDNLKKTAMALTTQKFEAPAPHEKIVVGGETLHIKP
jgi:hypothetical protein